MVCYTGIFHATSWAVPGSAHLLPIIQQIEIHTPIFWHPKDVQNEVTVSHLKQAAKLHVVLVDVPRKNPVWEALRSSWAALTSIPVIDATPSSGWRSNRSSDPTTRPRSVTSWRRRISFFLADTPDVARYLFKKVKACYRMRSIIMHGRWKDDPKIDDVMYTSEAIVRTVLRHLLDDAELLRTFISDDRDKFLEDWVFSRKMDPPPFPRAN